MNIGFSPDRPIETASQDSLGRSSLAFLLAQKISEWRGRESLVIALYGPWGSGKSSVKNLILEKLREEKYKPFDPIEFNPWLPSGVEKITESFFYEIGVKLSRENVENAKRRAAKWKRYAQYLELGSNIFEILNIPATAVGMPVLSPLQKITSFLRHTAKSRWESYDKEEKSLQQMRSELRNEFGELKTPIVVVIDDIDRLTEEEINLVFRLVKANADFPNLIFLLLFDRKTVEAALDKVSGGKGALFLEKIVQVGIDLPAPSPDTLRELLFGRMGAALEPFVDEKEFERDRFTDIWVPGLSHLLYELTRSKSIPFRL
jgi:predicted KAP-like P-loop ATPase